MQKSQFLCHTSTKRGSAHPKNLGNFLSPRLKLQTDTDRWKLRLCQDWKLQIPKGNRDPQQVILFFFVSFSLELALWLLLGLSLKQRPSQAWQHDRIWDEGDLDRENPSRSVLLTADNLCCVCGKTPNLPRHPNNPFLAL